MRSDQQQNVVSGHPFLAQIVGQLHEHLIELSTFLPAIIILITIAEKACFMQVPESFSNDFCQSVARRDQGWLCVTESVS